MASEIFSTLRDVLLGRFDVPERKPFTRAHLVAGLVFAWLAGMGRYWDHPFASWAQMLGLGSVAYVFVLAAFIWLLGLPIRLKPWYYRDLLICISLTSPLAFLYALPVERWMPIESARAINLAFLVVVAAWRVFIYFRYLRRRMLLSAGRTFVMLVLPLSLIVNALTFLNLERVIFDIMAGVDDRGSGGASSYEAVMVVSVLSLIMWIPTTIAYLVMSIREWSRQTSASRQRKESQP